MSIRKRSESLYQRAATGGWLAIAFILLSVWYTPLASAQQPVGNSPDAVVLTSELLFKSPAKLLFAGKNTIPTGKLKVNTYRLEEVRLPKPLEIDTGNGKEVVESVIRLSVTGEAFQPGTYTIWIGDESLTDVMVSSTELVTVVFDRSPLENGATISVSYETLGDHSRTVLPESLYVPAEAMEGRSEKVSQTTVTRISKVYLRGVPGNKPVIEIELTSKEVFSGRNSEQIFQIGEFETPGTNPPDGDGYKWIIRMPFHVFENLEDGTPILMKDARGKSGLRGARRIAQLNKAILER
jgi:hypothetical protein